MAIDGAIRLAVPVMQIVHTASIPPAPLKTMHAVEPLSISGLKLRRASYSHDEKNRMMQIVETYGFDFSRAVADIRAKRGYEKVTSTMLRRWIERKKLMKRRKEDGLLTLYLNGKSFQM